MVDSTASVELFEVVDDNDVVIGTAPRSRCHGDPSLVHRAAHVLVFNREGQLLLQRRAADKLIQPDRWDSSVGGHLDPGENYRRAAVREMHEELGIRDVPLTFLFRSQIRNRVESENVETFMARHDGPFDYCRREISEIRFWAADEIDAALGSGMLTPNFEHEWQLFKDWCRCYPASQRGALALCAGDTFPDLIGELQGL